MTDRELASWGRYAPLKKSIFLRCLIAAGFGRGAFRAKILKIWKKKFGNLVDIRVRGINYRLNLSNNITDCKILASSIIYDKKEIYFLQKACQDGVFIDVGANIGYYSLTLAKQARCKVIAIEPNPPTLERLYYNVGINSSLKNSIIVIPLGVGENGEFKLHCGNDLGGASLHSDFFDNADNIVKIKTRPLFDILTEQNISRVDALKIDVEGMEDRALVPFFEKAPLQMWPKCIVIEDDHKQMWTSDLSKILYDKGYREIARTHSNAILQLDSKKTG